MNHWRRIVSINDPRYPLGSKISDPPVVLFARGHSNWLQPDLRPWWEPAAPSLWDRTTTHLAAELAQAHLTIGQAGLPACNHTAAHRGGRSASREYHRGARAVASTSSIHLKIKACWLTCAANGLIISIPPWHRSLPSHFPRPQSNHRWY